MDFGTDDAARLRALVVDGSVVSATTLSCLLQVVGCKAAVAFGASMATRVAELFQPTLVLLDLGVLEQSGCKLLQSLRALDGPVSNALFACLAAEEDCENAQRWLACGCDRVLCKPLEPQVLADLLAQAQAELEVEKSRVKDASGERLFSAGPDDTGAPA